MEMHDTVSPAALRLPLCPVAPVSVLGFLNCGSLVLCEGVRCEDIMTQMWSYVIGSASP